MFLGKSVERSVQCFQQLKYFHGAAFTRPLCETGNVRKQNSALIVKVGNGYRIIHFTFFGVGEHFLGCHIHQGSLFVGSGMVHVSHTIANRLWEKRRYHGRGLHRRVVNHPMTTLHQTVVNDKHNGRENEYANQNACQNNGLCGQIFFFQITLRIDTEIVITETLVGQFLIDIFRPQECSKAGFHHEVFVGLVVMRSRSHITRARSINVVSELLTTSVFQDGHNLGIVGK
mmetsp:Transcript_11216/g.21374  ORF Transcript_11216/g.21374 Transcript_11216/m.21374 type:complete len:230 (+) Transcript_11216:697-1386(+)